jgi:hypothetical protein
MTPIATTHIADSTSFEVQSGSARTPPTVPKAEGYREASTTDVGYQSAGIFEEKKSSATPISIEVLYQAREARSAAFNRALDLLSQADRSLSEAIATANEDGMTAACALHLMLFEDLLQPLFECREIGEGFANVINTIHFGIANLKDEPLNFDQISTIWRVIRELSFAPFLSFVESLEKIRQLRKVGININSAFIDEWVSGAVEGGKQ